MPRCVFLDRDGVINRPPEKGEYIASWADFEFLPYIVDWIKLFRALGFLVIVVTNQRGVALGRVSQAKLDEIHARMKAALEAAGAPVDAVYCCPHEEGECDCRKPQPGMILQARRDFNIDLNGSLLIGDSVRDKDLAANCGIQMVMVSDGRIIAAPERKSPA